MRYKGERRRKAKKAQQTNQKNNEARKIMERVMEGRK